MLTSARLRVEDVPFAAPEAAAVLAAQLERGDVLAVFGFGADAPQHDDPRYLRIGLQTHGTPALEIWRGHPGIRRGRDGDIAWCDDGCLQFAALELDEPASNGVTDVLRAAEAAYARIPRFLADSGYPHVLRIWNYLDAITDGADDDERYRRFCVGRARGMGTVNPAALPAATAIGRHDGVRRLQVYWLASKLPGQPLENPRQVSAWHYPRRYGPQPPSFARAMLPPAGSRMPLLLSGTAAVVGYASRHVGQLVAQVDETLANLAALITAARRHQPHLPAQLDASTRLKVYVRNADDVPRVAQLLDTRLAQEVSRRLLHATICRDDLLVEIEGIHG